MNEVAAISMRSPPAQARIRPAPGRVGQFSLSKAAMSIVVPSAGIALLLAVWSLGGWLVASNPRTASFAGFAPIPALTSFVAMLADGSAWRALVPSLYRVLGGLGWAIAIGVPVGILIGRSSIFKALTHLPFQLLRMVSPLAWMPIAILAFNTWDQAIVFLIAAAAVWPVMFSTASGLQKVDPDWFKVAHNLGAKAWHILSVVIVPAIAHDILTGIRLALGVAWIVLVPVEYLGVTSGLGYAINDARDTLEYDRLAALILIIGIVGFTLDGILVALIKRFAWTRQS
jgi:NitT/TauT family transport system permease protein